MKRFYRKYKVYGWLLVLGFLIYGCSLDNSFLLDDESQIVTNELVHSPSHFARFFLGSTMNQANNEKSSGVYYKPLMVLAYSILWWLTPNQAFSFHLLQLLFAIANSMLLFKLMRKWLSENAAAVIALIYLAHPINSEVVVYVADLQDLMYTFFGLAAMNVISRPGKSLSLFNTVALAAFFLLSLFSKESGIQYVVLSLVYAFFFCRERLVKLALSSGTVVAFYLWLRIDVAQLVSTSYGVNQIGRAPLALRLTTAPLVLFKYLFNFVYPRTFTTTQDWVVDSPDLLNFYLPAVTVCAALALATYFSVRWWRGALKDRRFAFFTFWVFMGMGFHSHILTPLDGTFADRWFYFPAVGLLGMLGVIFDRAFKLAPQESRPLPLAATLGFAALILGLSTRSFARSLNWKDNYTICVHDLEDLPNSYDLHNNLGVELFRQGKILEARKEFEISTQLTPIWDINWNNLGATYSHEGDYKKAEEYYLHALANGEYFVAYENYAAVLISENRIDEAKTFIETKGLPRFPASGQLHLLYQSILKYQGGQHQ